MDKSLEKCLPEPKSWCRACRSLILYSWERQIIDSQLNKTIPVYHPQFLTVKYSSLFQAVQTGSLVTSPPILQLVSSTVCRRSLVLFSLVTIFKEKSWPTEHTVQRTTVFRSLVYFSIESHVIKIDNTSWSYSVILI